MGNNGVYYIHDNRIHDNYDCEELQIGNPGETDYVWNNIWYSPNLLNPSQANGPEVPQSETPVAMYFWNNTVVDSVDGCMGNAGHGSTFSTASNPRTICASILMGVPPVLVLLPLRPAIILDLLTARQALTATPLPRPSPILQRNR